MQTHIHTTNFNGMYTMFIKSSIHYDCTDQVLQLTTNLNTHNPGFVQPPLLSVETTD